MWAQYLVQRSLRTTLQLLQVRSLECSGMSRRALMLKSTYISEVRTASIIRAMMKYAPLNYRSTSTWLHGATSQKTLNLILATVRTWNLTYYRFRQRFQPLKCVKWNSERVTISLLEAIDRKVRKGRESGKRNYFLPSSFISVVRMVLSPNEISGQKTAESTSWRVTSWSKCGWTQLQVLSAYQEKIPARNAA
jgi:hypothetical protein